MSRLICRPWEHAKAVRRAAERRSGGALRFYERDDVNKTKWPAADRACAISTRARLISPQPNVR